MPTTVLCPHCGKPVEWTPEATWRPFCSRRCRLIDLGDWLDETHRISDAAPDLSDDAPYSDGEPPPAHH